MPILRTNTAKAKNQVEKPSSGSSTDHSASIPPEVQHDINDALGGRKFLEHHLLLCPEGEPPTHLSLATCLYQISAMAGIAKPAMNAIRSVAFLLEELEDTQINGMVKEAFDSQIMEFTTDIKMLIEHTKDKIDSHLKETEGQLMQVMDNVAAQLRTTQPATYASVLNIPRHMPI